MENYSSSLSQSFFTKSKKYDIINNSKVICCMDIYNYYWRYTTTMAKKATKAMMWAICFIIATIIVTFTSTSTKASASEDNTDYITKLAYANDNSVFMVGSATDEIIPEGFSVSDYVNYYKENLLGIPVCMYNHRDVEPSESTVKGLKDKLEDPLVKVTVSDDVTGAKADIVFERWDEGRIIYDLYTFDYSKDAKADDAELEFNYLGFRYTVYTINDKFYVSKLWDPEANTRVYETYGWENDVEFNALKQKLRQAFTEGTDITFIDDNGCIHAFVNNNGKEEYIFNGWNEKPIGPDVEFITMVKSLGDEYTIYVVDDTICLDSAKHAGYYDHHPIVA